jgi:hypothetical protein
MLEDFDQQINSMGIMLMPKMKIAYLHKRAFDIVIPSIKNSPHSFALDLRNRLKHSKMATKTLLITVEF